MNLKTFHIVFVTISTLMSFGFGGWCWHYADANQSPGFRALAAISFVIGIGLIFYGFWFLKKINTMQNPSNGPGGAAMVFLALLLWLVGQPAAEACTTCYGEAEGPLIDAARAGVFLLFGLVAALQIAFVTFFMHLRRRAIDADQ